MENAYPREPYKPIIRFLNLHFDFKDESAFDLFFVYRWLLLELKREFPFDEALMMLEIHWSSFYPSPPTEQLHLTDYGFV